MTGHSDNNSRTMLTLPLHKLRRYKYPELLALIVDSQETEFEILILRHSSLKSEEDSENYFRIYWDYTIAAWAGLALHAITDSLSYRVPTVYKKEPFSFEVLMHDPVKFVRLLIVLIRVYNPKDRCRTSDHFYTLISQYFADYPEERIHASIFGLINTADLHLMLHAEGPDYIRNEKMKI